MEDNRKIIRIGLTILAVVVVVGGLLYYFLEYRKPGGVPSGVPTDPVEISEAPKAVVDDPEDILALPRLELETSDDIIRGLVQDISSHPRLASWLKTKELVRKFVAAVDNVANGVSPRAQIDFFVPSRAFTVSRGYVAPASFDRYDPAADVFVSLDAVAAARLYRSLQPLIQEAYRELGYPDQDFKETLIRAMSELLSVPLVEGRVRVDQKVLAYVFADPELEKLSPAQKHFLRMGRDNVQVIQGKIREIAAALNIPEKSLPRTRSYTPSVRRP
jgi:hypothetical protein